DQFIVAAPTLVTSVQAHLLDVNLVLERIMALRIANPHGAGWRLQGKRQALQNVTIVVFRSKVLLRKENLDLCRSLLWTQRFIIRSIGVTPKSNRLKRQRPDKSSTMIFAA